MKHTNKWYLALAAIFILAFTPSVNAAMKDINAAQFDALLNFDANEDDVADVWVAARFAAPENFKGGADADGDALSNQDEYNMTLSLLPAEAAKRIKADLGSLASYAGAFSLPTIKDHDELKDTLEAMYFQIARVSDDGDDTPKYSDYEALPDTNDVISAYSPLGGGTDEEKLAAVNGAKLRYGLAYIYQVLADANFGYNPNDATSNLTFYAVDTNGDTIKVTREGDVLKDEGGNDVTATIANPDVMDCEIDEDGDQVPSYDEINFYGTDPNKTDTDEDGLDDFIELFCTFTDPADKDSRPWFNRVLDLVTAEHAVKDLIVDKASYTYEVGDTTVAARTAPYAIVADFQELTSKNQFSAEFWFKLDAASGNTGALLNLDNVRDPFWIGLDNGVLTAKYYATPSAGVQKSIQLQGLDLSGNTGWIHVAFTAGQENKAGVDYSTVAIYALVDGVEYKNVVETKGSVIATTATVGDLIFGERDAAAARLSFVMDEVRVWNKTLSESEIKSGRNAFSAEKTGIAFGMSFEPDGVTKIYSGLQTKRDAAMNARQEWISYLDYYRENIVTIANLKDLANAEDHLKELFAALGSVDAEYIVNYYGESYAFSVLSSAEAELANLKDLSNATDEQKEDLTNATGKMSAIKSMVASAYTSYQDAKDAYYLEASMGGMQVDITTGGALLPIVALDDTIAYLNGDSDGDSIADAWELTYFGNTTEANTESDYDEDGLEDKYEYILGGDPTNTNTWNPSVNDADFDSDGDGLANVEEFEYSCDPLNQDTDDDGVSDKVEVVLGSSPAHPMSIIVDDKGEVATIAAGYDWATKVAGMDLSLFTAAKAPARSLDLGKLADSWLELPDADRFAAGEYEPAVQAYRTENGDFTLEMWVKIANGDENVTLFETRSSDTRWGWRLVLENGIPRGEIFNANGEVIGKVGGNSATGGAAGATPAIAKNTWTYLALRWTPGTKGLTLYRDKIATITSLPINYTVNLGNASEYAKIQKADGVAIDEFRFWTEARSDEQIEYWAERMIPAPITSLITWLPTAYRAEDNMLRREYRLQAYYRFDDGGETLEDFVHFRNADYELDLAAATFEEDAKAINGIDDIDGDSIPEWWLNYWKLNQFPNAMTNYGYVNFYEVPGVSAPWKQSLGYDDQGNPVSIHGFQFGITYAPIGGDTNYDSYHSDYIYDYGMDGQVGGEAEGAYVIDSHILSQDMRYVTQHKYFNLNNVPTAAVVEIDTILGASVSALIINGKNVAATSSNGRTATYVIPENVLKLGRNQIVIVWTRGGAGSLEYKWKVGDKELKYTREYFRGSLDCGLYADNETIIAKGHNNGYDPRAVWYFRATTKDSAGSTDFGGRGADGNTYVLNLNCNDTYLDKYAANYGVMLDQDGDGLEVSAEYLLGTSPMERDSDNNGIFDGLEDADLDGLSNQREINDLASDPLDPDTDNDGVADNLELSMGIDHLSDPNLPGGLRALEVNGTAGTYAQLPLQSRFALGSYTLEAYVNPEDEKTSGVIIGRVVGTVDPKAALINYELGLKDGMPYARFTNKDGSDSGCTVQSTEAIKVKDEAGKAVWTHLAMTYNEATAVVALYVDGVAVASRAAMSVPVQTGPAEIFTRVGENFSGRIDEVRIWDTARTVLDLNNGMSKSLKGDEANLVAYYRFDDANIDARANDIKRNAYPYLNRCADSVVTSARDWNNNWNNAAVLMGDATVVEIPEDESPVAPGSIFTPAVGISAYSKGSATDITSAIIGNPSDVLTAVITRPVSDPEGGVMEYKYFWLKSGAVTFSPDEFFFEDNTLKDSLLGSEIASDKLLARDVQTLDLGSTGLKVGDYIQVAVVATSTTGAVSNIAFSQVVELVAESPATGTVLKPLTVISPVADVSGLAAGGTLKVTVQNENAQDGTVRIAWYQNMVLVQTSSASIAANGKQILSMSGDRVKEGDVWSFKVWFEAADESRSAASPAGDKWIYMMVGTGYSEEPSANVYPVAAPTKPTQVTLSFDYGLLMAEAVGSFSRAPFTYYYQYYRRANGTSTYVELDSTKIADLKAGDTVYCTAYAMNIYGAKSGSVASNVITVYAIDGTSGEMLNYFERNDNYKEARRIVSKSSWMSGTTVTSSGNSSNSSNSSNKENEDAEGSEGTEGSGSSTENEKVTVTDTAVQTHTFKSINDQDWVWFVVPENPRNRRMLVSFETNTGKMFQPGFTKEMYNAPDTAMTLYKQGEDGKPIEMESFRDFTANNNTGDATVMARFEQLPLEPGVYYIQVYLEKREQAEVGIPYYMHLFMEEEIANMEPAPRWATEKLLNGHSIAEINPANPGVSDDLTVSLNCKAFDGDDNEITDYYYLWLRNGVVVPFNGVQVELHDLVSVGDQVAWGALKHAVQDKTTIPAAMTQPGEVWSCMVYPYTKYYGFGEPAVTQSVVIGSSSWSMEFTTRKSFANGNVAAVNAGDEVVTIGWEAKATNGFDATYDDAAASLTVPNGDGTYTRQPLAQGALYSLGLSNECPWLVKDIRPYGKTSSWFIVAEMGDSKADTCTEFALSWNAAGMPASSASALTITQMRRRSDGYYESVAGSTVTVRGAGSGEIVLDANKLNALQSDENGQRYVVFRVTIGAPDSMSTITLKKGWNIIALPLTPMNSDVDDVFAAGGVKLYSGSIWEYVGGRYVAARNIAATRGYWLYSKVDTTVNVYGTTETSSISLAEGWNIVGPVYEIANFVDAYKTDYPEVYKKIAKQEGNAEYPELYEFDVNDGGYKLVPNYKMQVGKGYWLKATEAVELPVINNNAK